MPFVGKLESLLGRAAADGEPQKRKAGAVGRPLPLLGSNQDSPDPEGPL